MIIIYSTPKKVDKHDNFIPVCLQKPQTFWEVGFDNNIDCRDNDQSAVNNISVIDTEPDGTSDSSPQDNPCISI